MHQEQHRANRVQWVKSHYNELWQATEGYARRELGKLPSKHFDHIPLEARDVFHAAIIRILKRAEKDKDEQLTLDQCIGSIKTYIRFICREIAKARRLRNSFYERGLDGNSAN